MECLAAGCFFAVFPDLTTFCAPDPSIFSSKEKLLVSPGSWRMCPGPSAPVSVAADPVTLGSIDRFVASIFDVGPFGNFS